MRYMQSGIFSSLIMLRKKKQRGREPNKHIRVSAEISGGLYPNSRFKLEIAKALCKPQLILN
jgi:hypothetical protein